jgi:hypothetical protein
VTELILILNLARPRGLRNVLIGFVAELIAAALVLGLFCHALWIVGHIGRMRRRAAGDEMKGRTRDSAGRSGE